MGNKWEFDKEYLEELIKKGNELLNSNKISRAKKKLIQEDIETFSRFLCGYFSLYRETDYNEIPLNILKRQVLKQMKKYYKILGPKLIDWTISLQKEGIFGYQENEEKTILTMEEQVPLTLENYNNNSKYLLYGAQSLLSTDPISQIQVVEIPDADSYCYSSDITYFPFMVVNPNEAPSSLNHELEHGIEDVIGYSHPELFRELGPMVMESLFLDVLASRQGFLYSGDFQDRFELMTNCLEDLAEYFEVMKEFAKKDFIVSMDEFKNTFFEKDIVSPMNFEEYLKDEILDADGITKGMKYLYSFLKAIEIREKSKISKDDVLNLFDGYIYDKRFNFNPQYDSFKVYKNYVEEMNKRIRKN